MPSSCYHFGRVDKSGRASLISTAFERTRRNEPTRFYYCNRGYRKNANCDCLNREKRRTNCRVTSFVRIWDWRHCVWPAVQRLSPLSSQRIIRRIPLPSTLRIKNNRLTCAPIRCRSRDTHFRLKITRCRTTWEGRTNIRLKNMRNTAPCRPRRPAGQANRAGIRVRCILKSQARPTAGVLSAR